MKARTSEKTKGLSLFVLFVFFSLFVAVAARPLGNNRTPDGVLGSFDSTGAAILIIGFPYLFLKFI